MLENETTELEMSAGEKALMSAIKFQAQRLGIQEGTLDIEIMNTAALVAIYDNGHSFLDMNDVFCKYGKTSLDDYPDSAKHKGILDFSVRIFDLKRNTELKHFFAITRTILV